MDKVIYVSKDVHKALKKEVRRLSVAEGRDVSMKEVVEYLILEYLKN